MNARDLKRKIRNQEGFPALPGSLLALLEATTAQDGKESSHRLYDGAEFQVNLVRLFPVHNSSTLELSAFWQHSFFCARLAHAIAESIDSRWLPIAFAAGLLHDLGKLALNHLEPQAYASALEMVRNRGFHILESERQELGADHSLAGKWLGEAWNFPEAILAAIWLHHHPPKALEHTEYPLELIDIVALADLLAHRHGAAHWGAGHSAAEAEERRRRLALPFDSLKKIMHAAGSQTASDQAQDAPSTTPKTPPRAQYDELQQRLHCYEVLHSLHRGAAETKNRGALLRVMVSALRDAFALRSGCCYLIDESSNTLEGALWRHEQRQVESIALKLKEKAGPESESEPFFARLLRKLVAPGSEAKGLESLVRSHGLTMIPIARKGTPIGQMLFDATASQLAGDSRFLPELSAFGEACALALERQEKNEKLESQCEAMSTSLWKQELGHRQSLRSERLAAIGRMAAGAAHEINNPLAAISGRAQMLLSKTTNASEIRSLEAIVQQSRRINKIVTDLMQFARPASPKIEETQISFILHQVVATLRSRLEQKGITIYEDYAQHLPPVRLDRHQVGQAFTNIVINAEQAMEEAGGTLSLSARPSQDGRSVITRISDTGPGIPNPILGKIFEPFFSTRETTENTGLGLAVCHGIVESHRGAISVQSSPETGATFTLSFPAFHAAAQPLREEIASSRSSPQGQ